MKRALRDTHKLLISALRIISSQGIKSIDSTHHVCGTCIRIKNSFNLSNRSHAYMKINKLYEAVRDAKYTVAMRPDWGKGYFRLGRALSGLDKPDEALVAFFHCLVLEETCSKALRAEIVQVFKLCGTFCAQSVFWQEFCTIMFKEESKMDLDGQPALDSSCSSLVRSDKERDKRHRSLFPH